MTRRALAWMALLVTVVSCDRPTTPTAEPEELVVVDWLGRGRLYVATVVGRAEGLTGVEYADGDREWVEPARIHPWPELRHRRVQVWLRESAQDVEITELRGELLHVRFADGASTWVSRDMLYALEGTPPDMVAPAPTAPHAHPSRMPADAASIRPGAYVLAYRAEGENVRRAQPMLVRVEGVEGETVIARFLSDRAEQRLPISQVVRVLEPAPVTDGQRAWVAESTPIATVLEHRAGLVKIALGGEERWVDADHVIAAAPPIPMERLTQGALVTALWNGGAPYEATVQRVEGDQVLLVWHDESPPSPVPVSDVIDVWRPDPNGALVPEVVPLGE